MSLTNTLVGSPVTNVLGIHKVYNVDLTNLKAGGNFTTVDIVLEKFPAGTNHLSSRIKHTQSVDGTGFSAANARLKWVTQAATPVSTPLGSGTLGVFTDNAPGVLDGTSSITSVTQVAGDTESENWLIMTVNTTGGNLSAATQGNIEAIADVKYVGF